MNHKLDTDTHVFFYEQEFYVLSNFSSFAVEIDRILFPTAEHAYHYFKFAHTEHHSIAEVILQTRSAHNAFTFARKNKEFVMPGWDNVKAKVMKRILWAKYQQHDYVMRKLFQTGDRILVEDSWRDDVWGWGENKDGQNLLGKLWMEIRAEIRSNKE